MASVENPAEKTRAPGPRLDKPGAEAMQGEPGKTGVWRPSLRVRTLVTQRWLIILGELGAMALMGLVLKVHTPYPVCLAVIGLAAWINVLMGVASPGTRLYRAPEATAQLAFDILQISVLIFLTGGAANPFILMLIAPVTLAAATLPLRPVLVLGALAIAATVLLAVAALPPPATDGLGVAPSLGYRLTAAAANIVGIALIAGYVRQAAEESARMALALDVTQAVLAREQRLSALGALAAAAAHELGTPLATISIVAKEMARDAPSASVKEDAELLIAQSERCREILRQLTKTPDAATDEVHERMSLLQFVHEVIEPHADAKEVRLEAVVTGAPGVKAPDIYRRPEILHAMTTFVENALDFARSEVLVTVRFDADQVLMEVRDDGPGFAPEVLAKLGEPYVTTRPGAEGSRTGHVGMGLGFFIAKTLLERTGGVVTFQNGRPHGAIVASRWARPSIEVQAT